MKKFLKILLHLFLVFLAVTIEVGVFKKMVFPFNQVTIILPVVIYLMVVFNLNYGLWWAVAGGFLLDLFSVFPFGSSAVGLVVAVAAMHKLFIRFFTNRSLYSLMFLTMLGTLIYKCVTICLSFIPIILGEGMRLFYFNLYFFKNFLALTIANIFVVSLMFFITNLLSKRLKPVYVSIRNPITYNRFKN